LCAPTRFISRRSKRVPASLRNIGAFLAFFAGKSYRHDQPSTSLLQVAYNNGSTFAIGAKITSVSGAATCSGREN
jgi:hypothetical protein